MPKAIAWFADSPDVGHPTCICSWCGEVIARDEETDEPGIALRLFDTESKREARFHVDCFKPAIASLGEVGGHA